MFTNAAFSADAGFIAAVELAKEVYGIDLKATAAQASKFRRGFGAAYNAQASQDPTNPRPIGSKVDMKTPSAEALDAQKAKGRSKAQEYGPYAASTFAANSFPKTKKK